MAKIITNYAYEFKVLQNKLTKDDVGNGFNRSVVILGIKKSKLCARIKNMPSHKIYTKIYDCIKNIPIMIMIMIMITTMIMIMIMIMITIMLMTRRMK